MWLPIALQGTISANDLLNARSVRWLQLHARLKPGVTPEQAQADLDRTVERLAATYPDVFQNRRALVLPLWQTPWGAPALMRGILMVLSVAVSFVLILTAANVANLLVARALDRRREMAMRLALGASRGRLIRQMLLESLLLGLLGGLGRDVRGELVVATVVRAFAARWLFDSFQRSARYHRPRLRHLHRRRHRHSLRRRLRDSRLARRCGGRAARGGAIGRRRKRRARLRRVLVAAEVAIATVVLIAAMMSLRSIQRAERINPGFNPDGVFLAGYDLRSASYSPERGRVFHLRVLERLRPCLACRA